jgi:purine nucleoside phosphorylase
MPQVEPTQLSRLGPYDYQDHISMFTVNPLPGKNEEAFGTRFPDMSEPYKKYLIAKQRRLAGRIILN